ncbi:hypothetical protein Smar_0229 [Staphylothermus marinus F1]|uniref:Uncharacterized protein n=1 Tax=Staphylothermus marinus (strain ATCC 43588 / DSM 3639 / JCM 9404 / F1) TaxID=399550 RepID=A3DL32_STAMF|nr:hypothetical protein [Staphylothermus marinus]ABN69342.1 hypothetical protein Smar_0229 [Staphylothermus marinus F1]
MAKEQGLNIVMHYIGKCIEENIRSVRNINVSLYWAPDFDQERGDVFEIYPVWKVDTYLVPKQLQEGMCDGVIGYSVSIRTDTDKTGSTV